MKKLGGVLLLCWCQVSLLASSAPPPLSLHVGFSHAQPSARAVVLGALAQARISIYVAAYQYTDAQMIQALLDAQQRGVKIAVLLDRTQEKRPIASTLASAKIACRIDQHFRIMHHKFMVIDAQHVQTGSFNYSVSADQRNAENALYLQNVPQLAQQYQQEWLRLQAHTKPCRQGQ